MLLEELHARLSRPLSVLEVGVGDGKMLRFLGGPSIDNERYGLPSWIARWDGLDVQVEQSTLRRYSYSDYIEADIEASFSLGGRRYDAIVLLHVLEHLFAPEKALSRLLDGIQERGALMGGSPTMPGLAAMMHEPLLRNRYKAVWQNVQAHRHLSVITPGRIRRFAKSNGMSIDLIAGAFFCRWTNLFLENYEAWARANVLWGALFPALGGELYFSIRRGPRSAA